MPFIFYLQSKIHLRCDDNHSMQQSPALGAACLVLMFRCLLQLHPADRLSLHDFSAATTSWQVQGSWFSKGWWVFLTEQTCKPAGL